MDRMWAPWRLTYVTQDRKLDGCFLCEALASHEDRENLLLYRGDTCGIVMNRYPYNNGHLMVFPYRHVGGLSDLTMEERDECLRLAACCTERLRDAVKAAGFNVGINLGHAAGAGLEEHLHMHVVPRWDGDTNFMPVLSDVRVIPQALLELYDRLVPAFRATP